MKSAVVIPLYKVKPSADELISLCQCFKVLNSYNIIFVVPYNFKIKEYLLFTNHEIKEFPCQYFDSIDGYNNLLKSSKFYFSFIKYKYILIYQLDAFVFKNDLSTWLSKGYDFVGAPWFNGFNKITTDKIIIGVGNGGFSLRNTKKAIIILRRLYLLRLLNKYLFNNKLSEFLSHKRVSLISKFIMYLFSINNVHIHLKYLLTNTSANEDGFWSIWVNSTFSDFKVASINEAMKFSFEVNPSLLYQMNNNELPFGCHAWRKYEFDNFWSKFISLI